MPADQGQYCDIVMKGGITSGIVYPNAVIALAAKYRFKNIGGTSAGAIAAAATAAAALGQRRKDLDGASPPIPGAGFEGLVAVADKLKTEGFIYSLFQPAKGVGGLYRLVTTLSAKPGKAGTARALVGAALRLAPGTALISALLLFGSAWLLAGWRGLVALLLPGLACVFALSAIAAAFKAARLLRGNLLGLCVGLAVGKNAAVNPGLTDWLHGVLQSLAGKTGEPPLTFNDLWRAPRYPDEPKSGKTLQLAMITTGVSHHEPRTMPFEKARFWYREDEFRRLFPADVLAAITDPKPIVIGKYIYHRLPKGGALPVIVAARMSLSFPLLISAVPLHEPNYRAMAAAAKRARESKMFIDTPDALAIGGSLSKKEPTEMRVCWFSDGGIASNFPIHLFDTALPRWPTFAMNLTYPKSNDAPKAPVFLPTENKQGWQRIYSDFQSKSAFGEIGGFLFAIVATMQNWRDLLQSRAPGHRDRIVHIALDTNQGGMNLNMDTEVLGKIADKGTLAGQMLVKKFKFNNHWWVRWRNVASSTERFLGEFAISAADPISASYAEAHQSASAGKSQSPSYKFTVAQNAEAQRRFKLMLQEGALWNYSDPDLTKGAPNPLPHLRIMPTY